MYDIPQTPCFIINTGAVERRSGARICLLGEAGWVFFRREYDIAVSMEYDVPFLIHADLDTCRLLKYARSEQDLGRQEIVDM